MARKTPDCIRFLVKAGIDIDDAFAFRRAAMTLQRWFELECGNGNDHGSWAIERDEETEKPFMVHHHYLHGRGKDYTTRTRIPDKEAGARERIAKILTKYPGFGAYIQTDPRGASLWIIRPGDIRDDQDVSCCYTNGIAVYK